MSSSTRRTRPQPPKRVVQRAKVMVVGDSGVGKSWFVSRVAQRAYTTDSTVGVDFVSSAAPVKHREREWRLNYWDMGGLGVYEQIRSELYKPNTANEPNCLIFMFSVASRTSFRHLDQWYAEAQQYGDIANTASTTSTILLGNQCDVSFAEREVTAREAQQWASAHRMQYFEVSALCGTGVDATMSIILDHVSGAAGGGGGGPSPMYKSQSSSSSSSSTNIRQPQQQQQEQQQPSSPLQTPRNTATTTATTNTSSTATHRMILEMENALLTEWSIKELKGRLDVFQVSHAGCLTKADLVAKLRSVVDGLLPKAREMAAREHEAMVEEIRERVVREVQEWSCGKDIRAMLNSIHGSEQLERTADFGPVNKCYKRALLLIHPDKHNPNDIEAYTRATETFKAVNTAFSRFQQSNKKRASFS